jgi:hypothetical protein
MLFKYGGQLIVPRKCQYEGQVHYKLVANLKGKLVKHRGRKYKVLSKRAGRYQKRQGVNKKGQGAAPF